MITHKLVTQEYEITDGKHTIYCEIVNNKLTVTNPDETPFNFINSSPEVVSAIGKLIAYCGDELIGKKESD